MVTLFLIGDEELMEEEGDKCLPIMISCRDWTWLGMRLKAWLWSRLIPLSSLCSKSNDRLVSWKWFPVSAEGSEIMFSAGSSWWCCSSVCLTSLMTRFFLLLLLTKKKIHKTKRTLITKKATPETTVNLRTFDSTDLACLFDDGSSFNRFFLRSLLSWTTKGIWVDLIIASAFDPLTESTEDTKLNEIFLKALIWLELLNCSEELLWVSCRFLK